MSSIALDHKAPARKPLARLSEAFSNPRRVQLLAERIALHIESLVPRGRARCLDVGLRDLALAETVHARAPRTDWRCIEVGEAPHGRTLPFATREFDIALLCDVLQHTPERAGELLAEAGRVAKRVLVKDRFEYGSYSRTMLRLVDLVGTWGEGVGVPPRYFTREAFTRLVREQQFIITALDCGLSLYDQSPVARTVLRPDCDFIAVLRRVEPPAATARQAD
jgi:hypothetical protein